nr:hypothetical protein GCM10017745_82630 [Saccharothrix mutabilis subsp. capreolus]
MFAEFVGGGWDNGQRGPRAGPEGGSGSLTCGFAGCGWVVGGVGSGAGCRVVSMPGQLRARAAGGRLVPAGVSAGRLAPAGVSAGRLAPAERELVDGSRDRPPVEVSPPGRTR